MSFIGLEGLREGNIETFLDIQCERSAIIVIVLSSTKHEFGTKTLTPSWSKSEPKQTNSHKEDSTMSHATDRNEAVMTVIYGLQLSNSFRASSDKNPRFCTLVSALLKSGRNHKITGSTVAGPVFRYSTEKKKR